MSGTSRIDVPESKGTCIKKLIYSLSLCLMLTKLREVNKEVTVFDKTLVDISRAMFEVMYADDGIGLAAPQVCYTYEPLT